MHGARSVRTAHMPVFRTIPRDETLRSLNGPKGPHLGRNKPPTMARAAHGRTRFYLIEGRHCAIVSFPGLASGQNGREGHL